ncbi:homoserine kinase [Massilimaliae timonensis]|uniref:Homoserine kinase n=1 Tax=Massiliimalia timonensis TaxID=1987501 RepID=A0A8J6P6N0_9FIRM|nr:homoserine kinase [Massiliimalia timonensis]MBC8610245.1 homoserine kinase [Massiliimalia timonensis]
MLKIQIPATSANLGAGFDSLGLAVNLYNYVWIGKSDQLEISSVDGIEVPTDESNLVFSSAKHLFDLCGKPLTGMKIRQENNIPMTRGLGSSSACIIAGLYGANLILGSPFNTDELVDIAAKIEGHPDNTTPALLGGIVTSVYEENRRVHWVKQEIYRHLDFFAVVPDFELSTTFARQCLPEQVSHMDARYNLARAALFSASLLQGKYENIRIAVTDKLHQPYRMKLIPHAQDVFDKTYALGAYGTYISGAGPTLMSIVSTQNYGFEQEVRRYLDELGLSAWKIFKLSIDNLGTRVALE